MGARLAQITLIIFLVVSSVAVTLVSTVPSEVPVIQVAPKISTGARNETFTVDITIANVTWENSINGVYGWEFDMSFDPNILNVVSVMEGPWLKKGGETLFNHPIDNTAGTVAGVNFLMEYPETGVVGSGILANVTFLIEAAGKNTSLDLYKTLLNTYDAPNIKSVDHTAEDGFFSNVHDVAITSVTASPNSVLVGEQVSINVNVTNEGDFNETFDVTTYWKIGTSYDIIETKKDISLLTRTSKTLPFTWTPNTPGTYTIHANASVVEHEIDTADNTFRNGEVDVISPTGPEAIFTYSPPAPIEGETVTFNATGSYDRSAGTGGYIANYTWNFGDQNVTIVAYPIITHNYRAYGEYSVVLTVTDDDNETGTKPMPITVRGYPLADFTYDPSFPLKNREVKFDASRSHPKGGNITNYTWNFDDGNVTTVTYNNITHKYTAARVYMVNLTVTDSEGLTNSTTQNVTVSTRHDVAVVSVSTDYTTYDVGLTIDIYIKVQNKGTETETFNVTTYYDDTTIRILEVAKLAPYNATPTTKHTTWDTTGVSPGNYTIKAEAKLDTDQDLSNNWNRTREITLKPVPDVAITNVTVSSTKVLANDLLNITITVKNKGTTSAKPTIEVKLKNATSPYFSESFDLPDTLEPDTKGTWTFNWNVSKSVPPGVYTLSAEALLTNDVDYDDNKRVYGNITVGASEISISASPETIPLGSRTTISGSITPLRQNATVTIYYRASENDTWSILKNVTTNNNGTYSHDWKPEATGTYQVMANWKGDNKTLPSESETLTITVNPAQPNVFLYVMAAVGIIVIAATAIYLLRFRKAKPP